VKVVEVKLRVEEALEYIKKNVAAIPEAAVVLGSGLGKVAEEMHDAVVIPYEEIPHWPRSTAPGHAGRLVIGLLGGKLVALMQGRAHYYEGYSMEEVTFPVRAFGRWGIPVYIATNASGGIHYGLRPGDLVLVCDHINFMGANPLRGPNVEEWGPRFPDMTYAYDQRLLSLAEEVAAKEGILVKRGIYIAFPGPSYETPAEIRMARIMGADVVGMSTVPEVIVANHMGMKVCAISCVANYAAGMEAKRLTHEEVLAATEEASLRMARLLRGLIDGL